MYKVHILRENNHADEVYAGAFESISEACEASGVSVPVCCGMGDCGSCLMRVVKGTYTYLPGREHIGRSMHMDQVLLCSCAPTSDMEVSEQL